MKEKNILVFGGSGQIGRNLIRKLTQKNHRVTAVTRNLHKKGYILKTQGNPGYIDIVEKNIFDEKHLAEIIKNKDICINLVGILFEKKNNTFNNIHINFPSILSKICKENNLEQFIHISALGIDSAKDSKYAQSKLQGENEIKKNFQEATIIRPSIVYSVDDNFSTNLMSLINNLPFFPVYHNGETKFMPIHCSDLTEIILKIIEEKICSNTIECVGPDEINFKEILKILMKLTDKKKYIIPFPLPIAKITAKFFEFFPKPLLTIDQLNLLKYDNVLSGNLKSNIDINYFCKLKFENEVKKYCHMWKEHGEYSKEKIN